MKIFRSKIFATLILIAVIIVSTLLSANYSLKNEYNAVVNSFYSDDSSQGNKSIQSELNEKIAISEKLALIAKSYMSSSDKLLKNVDMSIQAMRNSSSPKDKYSSDGQLTTATGNLYDSLNNSKLSDDDKATLKTLYDSFNIASYNIGKNEYNKKVEDFMSMTSIFPANLLCNILHISTPEFFK